MAQRVEIHLIDDLDGEAADETVHFALDGVNYEIDLKHDHARELRGSLTRYVEVARKAAGTQQRGTVKTNREQTRRIRRWAIENGHQVSGRGRIRQGIQDAYHAAN